MKLTFEGNQFVLLNTKKENFTPQKDWVCNFANHSYQTQNISAASRFRKYADTRAEKIFNKLLLKALTIPSGGLKVPDPLHLMPFQEEQGVPFILGQNRTYLAHQPGLGKSAQSIVAANTKRAKQVLIVVPAFLKITWAREITKWSYYDFPLIAIVPESDKQAQMNWHAKYIIVSDSMISKEWVRAALAPLKFTFIFIDEAHRFKNPETSRTVSLFGGRTNKIFSRGMIYEAEHVVALSGTPMLARPIELWPILYAMAPETINFMNYSDFGFRYGGPWQDDYGRWHFTGASHMEELHERLPRFMQRIHKKDVLKDLPRKIREIVLIDKDLRKADVIDFDHELRAKLDNSGFIAPKDLGMFAQLRHINGLAKVEWSAMFVGNIMMNDPEESILLFAYHRDVVAQLAEKLAPFHPMIINGGVKEETRTFIEDAFQSGKRKLIIGNIDSMNLGLTLTKATRVIFAEYSETPAKNEQAEDRANRIGSEWSVFCQYLVLPNSIDEKYLSLNLIKEERTQRVIG